MELNHKQFTYPNVMNTSGNDRLYAEEDFMPEHVLCHIIGGEMRLIEATRQLLFRAGDTILMRRNHLVKCEKRPMPDNVVYNIIFFVLDKNFLQHYALHHSLPKALQNGAGEQENIKALIPGKGLQGLFNSMLPYANTNITLSRAMIQLKLNEALICLLEQDPQLADWLFSFPEPGKLDLQKFMQQNYMFNVPMTKFAELTGRSLSTFQRDFLKQFGIPATKWLLKRRLEAAHEALLQPGKKASEIYLELGFEDISHFSRTFKKMYGYNPSQVQQQ